MSTHFIEPLDVLILRGNKLFGDAGSYGESLLPPWPSVAAGALRSWLLVHDGVDLPAFAGGHVKHPTLGTPAAPGPFTLAGFQLARRHDKVIERLFAPPADLLIHGDDSPQASRLQPATPATGLQGSAPLSQWPALALDSRAKPASGWWLRESGWKKYLHGDVLSKHDLVHSRDLYGFDLRVGVGLDAQRRAASDGALFSTQTVALRTDVGFVADVLGAQLPDRGVVRLGGDGRGAAVTRIQQGAPPICDNDKLLKARRARIVLTSPGRFEGGWRLPGCAEDGQFELAGVRGRIVAAALPRAQVISGFDLAHHQPKPAERFAPAGSVYWLDDLQCSQPDALRKLADRGLWPEQGDHDPRRAEGFNRFVFAHS